MDKKLKIANQTAKDNGFDVVIYLGERDGNSVYLATTNEFSCTGLPFMILIDDQNNVETFFTLDYLDMVEE